MLTSLALSSPSLELSGSSLELSGSSMELSFSSLELSGPSMELRGPSLELNGTSLELSGPSLELSGRRPLLGLTDWLLGLTTTIEGLSFGVVPRVSSVSEVAKLVSWQTSVSTSNDSSMCLWCWANQREKWLNWTRAWITKPESAEISCVLFRPIFESWLNNCCVIDNTASMPDEGWVYWWVVSPDGLWVLMSCELRWVMSPDEL